MIVKGRIVDILNRNIFAGEVEVKDGKIIAIRESNHTINHFIVPGFVDAHIHIESSMLVPSEFAKVAVKHGTVASVSDPHEIANVLGVKGVEFMIENGKKVPFKFNFGAPSCVPATSFETSGAVIDAESIKELLASPDIKYLAEMMNYPGVLFEDPEVIAKIKHAKDVNKPIDGHAPGLRGNEISTYINAGISTDHECFTYDEAQEKLQKGMKVIIREGSAAKNFEALVDLIPQHFEKMMFCSDDKHPDDLLLGHINQLCRRAVKKEIDVFKVLQVACINAVKHYNLDVGLLHVGDPADFIVLENLTDFTVLETYINGKLVAKKNTSFIKSVEFKILNNFKTNFKTVEDFEYISASERIQVIEVLDGELITNKIEANSASKDGNLISIVEEDVLKMTVVNRYQNTQPSIAFIKNFGLKEGAIASSVGHDSHNIIAVGVSDEMICKAVNAIIQNKGGICAVTDSETEVVPLPVAGIMSDQSAEVIGKAYSTLNKKAKQMGSTLTAPYMSLSFMALLVIPSLKLSDKGLFDGKQFTFTSVEVK